MVISDERNNAKKAVRREYTQVKDKVTNEIVRRVSLGNSRYRVLAELATDIVNGDFDVSSPPAHGSPHNGESREPSVLTLRQTVEDLQSELLAELNVTRAPISPVISPHQRRGNRGDIVHLGNAMRNLSAEFSGLATPDARRGDQSDESWRRTSLNTVRMLSRAVESRRRNAEERARSLNDLNNLQPPRDPSVPPYHFDPTRFRASELTLTQSIHVMSFFDFNLHYERIKSTLLMYSLKIYGLEECRREDLRIAVFLFIEEHFKIQPVIELCVRPVEDHREPNVVGVLFQRTTAVNQIIENRRILAKTRYRVSRNPTPSWIIWNYDG